jgi:uncharacterized membrane protein
MDIFILFFGVIGIGVGTFIKLKCQTTTSTKRILIIATVSALIWVVIWVFMLIKNSN